MYDASKLGMITEEDGNEFGNDWSVTLTNSAGQEWEYSGERPMRYCGVHGLVDHMGELHLLAEDDGHFWTHAIMTEDDIRELKVLVDQFISELSFGKDWKVTPKAVAGGFKWDRPHPKFPTKFTDRKDSPAPLVSIMVNGEELAMDVSWLKTLSKVLDI